MKTAIAIMVFSIGTAISTLAVGGDIEDYAGLPIGEDETMPAAVEYIVRDGYSGYDGLPVTRQMQPTFVSVELENSEGYDGLPNERPLGYETWAFEE